MNTGSNSFSRSKRAESKKRNQPAGLPQEDAAPGEGIFPNQIEAESSRPRSSRKGAALWIRRAPAKETKFPLVMDRAYQCGLPRRRYFVQQVYQRIEARGRRSEPESARRDCGER